jgi:hypothetical protein
MNESADYFELRDGLENSRLVFEQTLKGRVVFLGGSITNAEGWKELVSADLQRRFPETRFDFINAGIPSTGSTPGAALTRNDSHKLRVRMAGETNSQSTGHACRVVCLAVNGGR